jgi:membrane-associated protein
MVAKGIESCFIGPMHIHDIIHWFQQNFLHLDKSLEHIVSLYGVWVYGILFAIVFCETGLVITPFLPGDALLFAVGAYSVSHPGAGLQWPVAMVLLMIAAILGNLTNFSIGGALGSRIFKENALILKKDYLDRGHLFFEKHGPKAVILARFLPVFRTLVPFVAGMASMEYARFVLHTVIGSVLWVFLMMIAGVLFGGIPWVQAHFETVVLAIVAVSMVPVAYEAFVGVLGMRKKSAGRAG